MDHALTPPVGFDRRILVSLTLAGATGAAFAEVGIPMSAVMASTEGPTIQIDSLRRTLAALAAGYDTLGPGKVATAVRASETLLLTLMSGKTSPLQDRELTALYGKFLALGAKATQGLGRYADAERNAKLAAHVAVAANDGPTAGHALATMSAAARVTGSPLAAVKIARRARSQARAGSSVVHASLCEAQALALLPRPDRDAVHDAVLRAENEHATLPTQKWGNPGFALGTYHPADLKVFGASALIDVGLFDEARARLDEAAEMIGERDGMQRAYLWLQEARAAMGGGDLDEAHDFAALAVAAAKKRPAAWAARIVGELGRASEKLNYGAFAGLVEQTALWGFPAA